MEDPGSCPSEQTWEVRPPSWSSAPVPRFGRLEVFERSGHYPFVEEPERFTAVAAAFLSSVPG